MVHDLNVRSTISCPSKTQTPLIIDSNAVLAFSFTFWCLKAIAWRYLQILEPSRPLELLELSERLALERRPTLNRIARKQLFSIDTFESFY
jgi:hypothetical protein